MRFLSTALTTAARKMVMTEKYGQMNIYAALVRNSSALCKASELQQAGRLSSLAFRCEARGNTMLTPVRSFRTGNGSLFAEAPKEAPKAGGSKGKSGKESRAGGWTMKDFLILGGGGTFLVLLTAPICGMDYLTPDHTGHVTPSFSFTQFGALVFLWLVLCIAIERGMHHQRLMTKQLQRGLDKAGKTGGFSLKM